MSILQIALQDALAKRFPSVIPPASARFMPMVDLSKGEISSTAAIEIARALRGDAFAIANELLEEISNRVPGSWKVVAGYMVLSDAPEQVLREESVSMDGVFPGAKSAGIGRVIRCLVPDSTSPVYARMRLIACSALQALLTVEFEGACLLGFEPDAPSVVSNRDQVLELVRRAVERCLDHESESRVRLSHPVDLGVGPVPLTAWTSHHYHDRLPKEVKEAFVRARIGSDGPLKIPSDGWLLSRERVLLELLSPSHLRRVIHRLTTKEDWLRWVYHFASSVPSGDLDPSVALYDECASPRWSLQVLYQRVSQLLGPMIHMDGHALVDLIVSNPLVERGMLLRALFLPSLTGRAVREGEVIAWSKVVEEFSARAHAILNAPYYRTALRNPPFPPGVMQINAGLTLGVVSILPAVTEG